MATWPVLLRLSARGGGAGERGGRGRRGRLRPLPQTGARSHRDPAAPRRRAPRAAQLHVGFTLRLLCPHGAPAPRTGHVGVGDHRVAADAAVLIELARRGVGEQRAATLARGKGVLQQVPRDDGAVGEELRVGRRRGAAGAGERERERERGGRGRGRAPGRAHRGAGAAVGAQPRWRGCAAGEGGGREGAVQVGAAGAHGRRAGRAGARRCCSGRSGGGAAAGRPGGGGRRVCAARAHVAAGAAAARAPRPPAAPAADLELVPEASSGAGARE
jgi:hypothetical protein